MTILSNPQINLVKASATGKISNVAQTVLIVGQQTGATYTTGQLVENIQNSGVEISNMGKNSHIAQMLTNYKRINQITKVDAIVLDDAGAGVKATGNVTFTTGPATTTGQYIVYVNSKKYGKYVVDVAVGDTVTVIGAALAALINADVNSPVTATNTAGDVELESDNAGTVGNKISIKVDDSNAPAGVVVATTAMTGGATNPVLTTVFDVVGDKRYQTVIWPYQANLDVLTDFLDPRWNVDNRIIDGVGVVSITNTFASIQATAAAENSQALAIHANAVVNDSLYRGSALLENDDVIASEFGAIRALRLTDDSNISRYVVGGGSRDTRGGTHLASKPYFNTPFFNLELIETNKGFNDIEVKQLITAGAFTIGNNTARNTVICGQVPTTYKTDVAANPDISFKYLNYVDTISNVTEFMFNNLKRDFAQHRLTVGDAVAKYDFANENILRSAFARYYTILSGDGFVLTRAGDDNIKFFKDSLDITIDLAAGLATIEALVPIVTQLRQINATLKVVFDINEL